MIGMAENGGKDLKIEEMIERKKKVDADEYNYNNKVVWKKQGRENV